MAKNIFRVQDFIEASTKQEIIKLQYENNRAYNQEFNYSVPQKDNGKYICWYFRDFSPQGNKPKGKK